MDPHATTNGSSRARSWLALGDMSMEQRPTAPAPQAPVTRAATMPVSTTQAVTTPLRASRDWLQYRAVDLVAYVGGAIALAGLTAWVLPRFIEPLFVDRAALHAFFFERSFVQWMTVTAFWFAAIVLVDRVFACLPVARSVKRQLEDDAAHASASAARQRVDAVRSLLKGSGAVAASSYERELAETDEARLDRVYSLLGGAVQLMLAFGFFGTVWGISRRLFASFGSLGELTADRLRESLHSFTDAFSTALDTTVLGLVLSIAAGIAAALLKWWESGTLRSLDKEVRRKFWLETAEHAADDEARARLESELPRLIGSAIEQMRGSMTDVVASASKAFEGALAPLIDRQLDRIADHETRLGEGFLQRLREELLRAFSATQEQSLRMHSEFVKACSTIEEAVRNTPRIVIDAPPARLAQPTVTGAAAGVNHGGR